MQGKTVLNGEIDRGLYRIPRSSYKTKCTMALTRIHTTLHRWHQGVDHLHALQLRRPVSLYKLPVSLNNFPNVFEPC